MEKISLTKIFLIFFKIGWVLFGGGYAILPFLQAEIVEKAKICTGEDLADYYALSQCFPGLVAGNISMFIGYRARGAFGALAAVLGICLPAFISIVVVFSFLTTITHLAFVQNIFNVLAVAVCILIFLTILELWEFSVNDKFTIFIFTVALGLSVLKVSPFIIVISAGLLGLIRHIFWKKKPEIKEDEA